MKRKSVKLGEDSQEPKLTKSKPKVTTLHDASSLENKSINTSEPVAKKQRRLEKQGFDGDKGKGKKLKAKRKAGVGERHVGVGLRPNSLFIEEDAGRPNSDLKNVSRVALGQGSDLNSGKDVVPSRPNTTDKNKRLKTNSLKTPTKSHEKLSKPVAEGSEGSSVNGIDAERRVANASDEDKTQNTLGSPKKQKMKPVNGQKSGLVMKKGDRPSHIKTKMNKLKGFSSNKKISRQRGGKIPETFTKPDWAAIKKEKKELRKARKQKVAFYNIKEEAKQIWEVFRNQTSPVSTESVQSGVIKVHNLLKSQLDSLVTCHIMSRVLQWLIRMGTPEIRTEIIEELKPSIKKMMINRYASKCVGSLLKYGKNEAADVIIQGCMGNIVKFMSNVVAHPYLEKAYAEYASDKQKSEMHSEFYCDLYKSSKDSAVKCLADTYKDSPALKAAFLTTTKENIKRVLNKHNATNRSTLLYAVLANYLKECSSEDRDELLAIVRGWIFDLPATKDAGQVGMLCVWHATKKEKKAIVKGLKGHIANFAKSSDLQSILFAVFSLVDDTVLLSKVLVPEVVENIKELGSDTHGRKLIVHLVSYGDPMFFHPTEMKTLKEGEAVGTAKKDHTKKRDEILHLVSKPFLESVAAEPGFWFKTSVTCLTALAILRGAEDIDEKQKAFVTLAKLLVDPMATCQEVLFPEEKSKKGNNQKKFLVEATCQEALFLEEKCKIRKNQISPRVKPVPLVSHSAVHLAVKHLIKETSSFPEVLAEEITLTTVEYWISHNRGCFTFIHLLESGKEAVVTKLQHLLKERTELITAQPFQGAKILHRKLET